MKAIGLAIVWFLVGCKRGPDPAEMRDAYKRLCKLECDCKGSACSVATCVEHKVQLATEQAARNCRDEGDAVVMCKLSEGGSRCERAGTLAEVMITGVCKPKLDVFAECLARNRPATSPQPTLAP